MKTTNIAAAIAFLSASVFAAQVALANSAPVNGRVSTVRVDRGGQGIIYLTAAATAGCANTPNTGTQGFAFDTNTKGGEQISRAVLSAELAGKSVQIVGSGVCTVYTTAEDIVSFYVLN